LINEMSREMNKDVKLYIARDPCNRDLLIKILKGVGLDVGVIESASRLAVVEYNNRFYEGNRKIINHFDPLAKHYF